MKIVVGLGNPGKQYEGTRHNVGWMVLDRLADRAGWSGRARARDSATVVYGRYRDLDLKLVKPTTYMNLSGVAVRKVLARERAPLDELLVVVDDFALPLGRMRIREQGSAGGHNGLRSIIGELGGQGFARLRVGIGEPSRGATDHVLSRFAADEQAILDEVIEAAADAVEDWARDGAARAASRWNTWLPGALEPAAVGSGTESGGRGGRAAQPTGTDRTGTDSRAGETTGTDPAGTDPTGTRRSEGETSGAEPTGQPAPLALPPAIARAGDDTLLVRRTTGWRRLLPRTTPEKRS